ncbi:MAG: ATP phosphoribosyltransferase [Candidatus Aminicenantes bacterium RBG_16_63_16]|nr:MAG: ATP phosphoribosyltransferase [Candidatus Aminicenantes bacterium RBG_16_63_16]
MPLRLVLPKGRTLDGVVGLLNDSEKTVVTNSRHYVPSIADKELEAKIMKPQNIAQLVERGSYDIGFTGRDWVVETGAEVVELLDLGLDPVRIVAAVPEDADESELLRRRVVVATEYENIARRFLGERGCDYLLLRTRGASEAFPPEDADMIIDNTATGRTLKEHRLKVVASILDSSTRFIANREALADGRKREKIEELTMLFAAVLNARERVMLEMNVPEDKLETIVRLLPCMRSPTVSPLYGEAGFAVKAAVKREEAARLIPLLKKTGATDILEYSFRKVVI